ncbi:MAG: arginine--tRNA ligase [Alphaproteobacteria bacterium]
MTPFARVTADLTAALTALTDEGALPALENLDRITVEPPRDPSHGDMASNAAMVLAKQAKTNPRALAEMVKPKLEELDYVSAVEIAGPGFINLRFHPSFWQDEAKVVLSAGAEYGNSDIGGGAPVNVEYVSANPTGPMHAAHARGAVVGDALANLLDKAGYDVTREYYLNDYGNQVEILGRSTHLRYREALGHEVGDVPEGMYPGDYLKEVGKALAAQEGDRLVDLPEAEWLPLCMDFAIKSMVAEIQEDLRILGIDHDVWTSEAELHKNGFITNIMDEVKERGLLYRGVLEPPKGKKPDDWEPREQTLLKTTEYGDDVDRPMQKSNGNWTYLAADIGYHVDKFRRTGGMMINILGADHGGYLQRMNPALKAATEGKADLRVVMCQLVKMYDKGEPVRMSKRAGTFVTLRDVLDAIGKDVMRFIMLTRSTDQSLEFDFAEVTEQTRENPVFYVQYAHARCCSIIRNAAEQLGADKVTDEALLNTDLSPLTSEEELGVLKVMGNWGRLVEQAAEAQEPHRIAFYLRDLASSFHSLWTAGKTDPAKRFLIEDDEATTLARVALVRSLSLVIASGLTVMGVTPVEEL